MPEYQGNGYKCYLKKLDARNNCVVNTPPGKNLTAWSQGTYIQSLYCSYSCNNGNYTAAARHK